MLPLEDELKTQKHKHYWEPAGKPSWEAKTRNFEAGGHTTGSQLGAKLGSQAGKPSWEAKLGSQAGKPSWEVKLGSQDS
jgi:hypothetical protein